MHANIFTWLNVLSVFLPWALNFSNNGEEILFLIFENFFLKPAFIKNFELIDKTNSPPGRIILKSSSNASGPTCPWVKVPALTTAPNELSLKGICFVISAW